MRLVDVVHEEMFCGELLREKYSCWNNRFKLFDKRGKHLNEFMFDEKDTKTKNIEVLEIKKSGYQGFGVGFPVTHIKIDYIGNDKRFGEVLKDLKFGEIESDYDY